MRRLVFLVGFAMFATSSVLLSLLLGTAFEHVAPWRVLVIWIATVTQTVVVALVWSRREQAMQKRRTVSKGRQS